MGWANGSYMAVEIWDKIGKYIPKKEKQKIAKWLYDYFCDGDADDWDGESSLEKDAGIKYD